MTTKKKKPTKPRQRSLVLLTAGSEEEAYAREAAAMENQKAHARRYADGIVRGELPDDSSEREFIAFLLRWWAAQVKVTNREARKSGFRKENL